MPTHLAPDEMLADYAAGATPPGLSLLLAAHLTRCPEARRRVAELESLGGALLADEAPGLMPASALDRALAAVDAGTARDEAPAAPCGAGPLPRPVAELVGVPFERIRWRFRLPGVAEYPLEDFPGEKVSLVRARPDAHLPQHTHRGLEATLILQGCLRDEGVEYRAGDLSVKDDHHDHRPEIVGPETCFCLIVLEAPLRFTGRLSRILNLLAR